MNASRWGVAALVGLAVAGSGRAQPGADLCFAAPQVVGDVTVGFNLTNADVDGVAHAGCDNRGDPQTWRDVWWVWTATCDGPARISTCGLTTVDTEIVVYSTGACPPSDDYIIACNDQSCGDQAEVTFLAQAGQPYLVRLGRYAGAVGTTGSVRFECLGDPICASYCEEGSNSNWFPSTSLFGRGAILWTPPADGFITSLCVKGVQAGSEIDIPGVERIRIVYYRQVEGQIGPAIAAFRPDGLATVASETVGHSTFGPIRRTSFRHTPVAVEAGQQIYIEVYSEAAEVVWHWSVAPGGENILIDRTPDDGSWEDAYIAGYSADRCIGFERATCFGDLDSSGAVNFADLNQLLEHFNTVCP